MYMNQTRFPFPLPQNPLADDLRRHADPVNGPFSVTATIPTLDEIIDWQEGRCFFDFGYYRFIDSPPLYRIQQGLQVHYQIRHCLLYTSFQSAALELLDYLLFTKPRMRIKLVSDHEAGAPFSIESSLSVLKTKVCLVNPARIETFLPFSREKDELLVINVRDPGAFIETRESFLKAAKSSRIPIVLLSGGFPPKERGSRLINYWVFPMNKASDEVGAGAILSNLDRQMEELKKLRIQRGPILSSRDAAFFLGESELPAESRKEELIERLCEMENARYGFLFPSGMQAISTLMNLLRRPEKAKIIAIGHLYTDTYALLTHAKQRIPVENRFIGVDEMDQFQNALSDQIAAIITETITNPLNDVPDLESILERARAHQIPVIVDNTFATPSNCKPLQLGVDFVVHSTTKYLNGTNDHGGGVILLNDAEMVTRIRLYQQQWGNDLSSQESAVLWEQIQDFEKRMQRFQANALQVSEFLQKHPGVDRLYFHNLPSHRSYHVSRRLLKGPGSVMSFTLKRPGLEGLRQFYDAPLLHILKAPSLGSNQTILCPYTMLAHYHESDECLDAIGLPRYLIRLSVGCEEQIKPVIDSLDQAL